MSISYQLYFQQKHFSTKKDKQSYYKIQICNVVKSLSKQQVFKALEDVEIQQVLGHFVEIFVIKMFSCERCWWIHLLMFVIVWDIVCNFESLNEWSGEGKYEFET